MITKEGWIKVNSKCTINHLSNSTSGTLINY